MFYVYAIRSLSFENKYYYGITQNISERLYSHNRKEVNYTSSFVPWELVTFVAIKDRDKAYEFEKYIKSHSGRAFAKKRLL